LDSGPFLIAVIYILQILWMVGYSGRERGDHSKDAHGISQHSESAKPLEGQIDIGEVHVLDKLLLP
jgi:hypothetical protein